MNTNSNSNPYPLGRWTPPVGLEEANGTVIATAAASQTGAPEKRARRVVPKLPPGLLELPLKQLFWGVPESQILEEAAAQIEMLLRMRGAETGESLASR